MTMTTSSSAWMHGRATTATAATGLVIAGLAWVGGHVYGDSAPSGSHSRAVPHAQPDRASAALTVMHGLGFERILGAGGAAKLPSGSRVTLTGPSGRRASITWQDDVPLLRAEFGSLSETKDGIQYGLRHTGYGAITGALISNGRALVFSVIPGSLTDDLEISDQTYLAYGTQLLQLDR